MQQQMAAAYGSAKLVMRQGDPPLWRVLAGRRTHSRRRAKRSPARIRKEQNLSAAFVVRLEPIAGVELVKWTAGWLLTAIILFISPCREMNLIRNACSSN